MLEMIESKKLQSGWLSWWLENNASCYVPLMMLPGHVYAYLYPAGKRSTWYRWNRQFNITYKFNDQPIITNDDWIKNLQP